MPFQNPYGYSVEGQNQRFFYICRQNKFLNWLHMGTKKIARKFKKSWNANPVFTSRMTN